MRRLCLSLLAVAIVGCVNSAGPIPVSGVVTLDEKPLSNASISFVPEGSGKQATGTTDENGKFVLSTIDPRDGAFPGKYKVVIAPNSVASETESESADAAMEADAAAAKKAKKPSGPKFPEAYTRLDQTPLTQDVPAPSEVVYKLSSK
jgi:hypothetical protein